MILVSSVNCHTSKSLDGSLTQIRQNTQCSSNKTKKLKNKIIFFEVLYRSDMVIPPKYAWIYVDKGEKKYPLITVKEVVGFKGKRAKRKNPLTLSCVVFYTL